MVSLTAAAALPGVDGNAVTLATSDVGDVTRSGATLTLGVDNTAGTAANLSAVIDTLPGYNSSVVGSVVSVLGPSGPIGNQVSAFSEGFNPSNFSFNTDRTLEGAEPHFGPPVTG